VSLVIERLGTGQKGAFASIWIPWLTETMGLTPEPEDLIVMADPAAYYGKSGGAAFVGRLDGQVVGAVAVKGLSASGGEFCKLVVTEAARGHGAGRSLVEACLAYCAEQGMPALWLQSFRKLDIALGLYERMGFEHAPPPPEMNVLGRTEVIMRKAVAA